MITGIHHIALRAADFDRSLSFYTEALGLTVRFTWGEKPHRAAMIVVSEGCHIELFEGGSKEKSEDAAQAGEWFHLAIRTDDPDADFQKAVAWGARPKTEPKSGRLGTPPADIRIAFVYGPSGEVIEFFKEG